MNIFFVKIIHYPLTLCSVENGISRICGASTVLVWWYVVLALLVDHLVKLKNGWTIRDRVGRRLMAVSGLEAQRAMQHQPEDVPHRKLSCTSMPDTAIGLLSTLAPSVQPPFSFTGWSTESAGTTYHHTSTLVAPIYPLPLTTPFWWLMYCFCNKLFVRYGT